MFSKIITTFRETDWLLAVLTLPIVGAGIIAMTSFQGNNQLAIKQGIWLLIGLVVFFVASQFDVRVLKRTSVLVGLFLFFSFLLVILFILGHTSNGAQSWFSFGGFSLQPSDFMKIIVILMLAKYFSRRHVEIAHFKHIVISGMYALIPFVLVFLQPDFGSAMVIFMIWFGMSLVAGISKRHLLFLGIVGAIAFGILWVFLFKPYQKARVMNFIHPYADIRGSGYNAYQAGIAVGSGQIMGKGIGFGTQSRLQFLPEYETDFIFAAFAEEWGFVGALLLLIVYGALLWRILNTAMYGGSNFEILFGSGVALYFMSHIIINVGMNLNIMPVTGITLPFMSYGGSHLMTEFLALGILSSMRKYRRHAHPDDMRHEFVGY
jgi:rod shape determining protein RodA